MFFTAYFSLYKVFLRPQSKTSSLLALTGLKGLKARDYAKHFSIDKEAPNGAPEGTVKSKQETLPPKTKEFCRRHLLVSF